MDYFSSGFDLNSTSAFGSGDSGSGFDFNSTSAFGGVLTQPDHSTSSGSFWSSLNVNTIAGLLSTAGDVYARVKGGNGPENAYRTYGSQTAQDQYGLGTPQPGAPGGNGAVLWVGLGMVAVVLLLKYAKD